jgi:hypothetical protein
VLHVAEILLALEAGGGPSVMSGVPGWHLSYL